MPNLFEEFRAVVVALGEAGVPFAVCGGLAMSIHARPRATSQARELCLSLKRAHLGRRALERLRAGEASALGREELHVALGLALAAGEPELVRRALAGLPPERVSQDAVLLTFRDAARAKGA